MFSASNHSNLTFISRSKCFFLSSKVTNSLKFPLARILIATQLNHGMTLITLNAHVCLSSISFLKFSFSLSTNTNLTTWKTLFCNLFSSLQLIFFIHSTIALENTGKFCSSFLQYSDSTSSFYNFSISQLKSDNELEKVLWKQLFFLKKEWIMIARFRSQRFSFP